ncbi:MAG: pepsin-like aspartyl protease [archaeon]|nr:pepsin-like aspartyl protease [archaeon]
MFQCSLNISILFFLISFMSIMCQGEEEYGIVKLPFIVASDKQYLVIPFKIGTPEQKMNLILDIGSERTWLSKEIYNKTSSTSYVSLDTPDKHSNEFYSISGTVSTDHFSFGDTEEDKKILKAFQFVYVDSVRGDDSIKGVISFGREYDTKRYSIVYKLSSLSITFYNMFQIKFIDKSQGLITVGDSSKEMKDKEVHQCIQVEGSEPIKWACELTHTFIGELDGETYNDQYSRESGVIIEDDKKRRISTLKHKVDFETVYNKIYVSKNYMDYLKKNYFLNNDGDKICKLQEGSTSYFSCSTSEVRQLKKINFVFSKKMALNFSPEKLFECYDNHCTSLIVYDDKIGDRFIFGLPIFRNYEIVFDYNVPKISFYGEGNISYVQMPIEGEFSFGKFFLILFIILVLILLAGIGVIYFLRNKNKVRKQIEDQIYENF